MLIELERMFCLRSMKPSECSQYVLWIWSVPSNPLLLLLISLIQPFPSFLKMILHLFFFDESYTNLQGYGSHVDLAPWYDPQSCLSFMVFRGGNQEELAFGDVGGMIRIYSLATQQFRCVALQLYRLTKSSDLTSLVFSDQQVCCSIEYHKAAHHLQMVLASSLLKSQKTALICRSITGQALVQIMGYHLRFQTFAQPLLFSRHS